MSLGRDDRPTRLQFAAGRTLLRVLQSHLRSWRRDPARRRVERERQQHRRVFRLARNQRRASPAQEMLVPAVSVESHPRPTRSPTSSLAFFPTTAAPDAGDTGLRQGHKSRASAGPRPESCPDEGMEPSQPQGRAAWLRIQDRADHRERWRRSPSCRLRRRGPSGIRYVELAHVAPEGESRHLPALQSTFDLVRQLWHPCSRLGSQGERRRE